MSDGSDALETAEHILDARKVDEADSLPGDIVGSLAALAGFSGVSERQANMERRVQTLRIHREEYESIPAKKITQTDRIRYWNSESDVAYGYLQEEKFDKVEGIMARCLAQYKSWGTLEDIPYEYAKYYYLKSFVRASDGSIEEALDLSKRGVEAVTKSAGKDHPVALLWRFSLANLLFHDGKVAKSLEINERILATRKEVCRV